MPSRSCKEGDTIYIRAKVVLAGSECFQVLIDDVLRMSITVWVPAGECAKHEDIGRLRPPYRVSKWHIER